MLSGFSALIVQKLIFATVLFVAALLGVIGVGLWRMKQRYHGVTIPQGQRMGKAPYAVADCQDLVGEVKALISDVFRVSQEAAANGWHNPDGDGRMYISKATQLVKQGEGAEALEQLRRAVDFLNSEWEENQSRGTGS